MVRLGFHDSDSALKQAGARAVGKKADLVESPQEWLGYFQDDLSGGAAVDLATIRFVTYTRTTFDPDHLKYTEIASTGWVYRIASEAAMVVVNTPRRAACVDRSEYPGVRGGRADELFPGCIEAVAFSPG